MYVVRAGRLSHALGHQSSSPEREEEPNFFHLDCVCRPESRLGIGPGPIFSSRGRHALGAGQSRTCGRAGREVAPQPHRTGPRMGCLAQERDMRVPSGTRAHPRRLPGPGHPGAEPASPPTPSLRCDRGARGSRPPGAHHRAPAAAAPAGVPGRGGTGPGLGRNGTDCTICAGRWVGDIRESWYADPRSVPPFDVTAAYLTNRRPRA
jgi:hypothetical protein